MLLHCFLKRGKQNIYVLEQRLYDNSNNQSAYLKDKYRAALH